MIVCNMMAMETESWCWEVGVAAGVLKLEEGKSKRVIDA